MKYKLLLLAASFCLLALPIESNALFSEYLFQQTNGDAFDMSGASQALGANIDDLTAGSFNIGFTFELDGTNYTTFTVSTNGWMKLGAHTTNSDLSNAFSGAPYPIISALWDDLRTHANGGYIRYQTIGSPGSRVLVVEWRTSYWSNTASGPWVYQVRLYETTNVIEFFYIDMPSNFSTTATIGMATSATNWISVVPGVPVATASTTVQTHSININANPIPAGTLYRFRRVLDDLSCNSVTFNSTNSINSFLKNDAVTVTASLENLGANPKNNIPFQFKVYYGNSTTPIYSSEQRLISPGNRFGTASVTFNAIPGTINKTSGIYTVVTYPTNPVDEDYSNDTCEIPYFVLGGHDILAFRILQPFGNVPPLFTKYPVGEGVPIEARFLNVGTNDELNVPIGYEIYRQGESSPLFTSNPIIPGQFPSATFRDVNLPAWVPTQPGTYCIRLFSNLDNDEARGNDSLPNNGGVFCFVAAYTIEVAAIHGGTTEQTQFYPIGRPIAMDALFENNGLTDATNTQVTMYVYDPKGNEVYRQAVLISDIVADGGRTLQQFPNFIPSVASGPGRYCVGVKISHPDDPVKSNDSSSFCFNVLSPLSGDILVGFGERFQTMEEARDSLFYLGVSGDVNFLLVDDEYTVVPPKENNSEVPAMDMRGEIIGAGENARITWMPHPSKTKVTIHLKSPSGIGMWFGQID
ncbi:MAG: hypothetical protein KDD67_00675, partial [Ignavibacteriae bacterium]|nr:hypothetical protein [Ignavibacteriota bacterium]